MDQVTIAVVIPVYNNQNTVASVVSDASRRCGTVIVVDDGSTDATAQRLRELEAPGVEIVTLPVNSGKGAALRAGLARALEHGFTHAITLDADGQHLAEDIPLFFEKISEDPSALWIGNRTIQAGNENQPARSKFGARFGAFWYRFHTGIRIDDTQCGFRAYPLEAVLALDCTAKRFGWELEVLIRVAWNKTPVKQVPVHLLYLPKQQRVSHFRPVRDFLRLGKINSKAALTRIFFPWRFIDASGKNGWEKVKNLVLRELSVDRDPRHAALSLAIGVCVALMPIHGMQVISLLAICFIFKLNKTLALLGVTVSSPPVTPLWIALEYSIGSVVAPVQRIRAAGQLLAAAGLGPAIRWAGGGGTKTAVIIGVVQWMIGSVIVALCAGVITFGAAFVLLRAYRRLKQSRRARTAA